MVPQRLQKIIAMSGLCSRRQAEILLIEGRVKVNGILAQLGDRAQFIDDIEVNGQLIQCFQHQVTLLINKPVGVISSCKDPQGRPTVLDLIPKCICSGQRLHPIGRLDINSRGALLLTTDGALTLQLSHPRYFHKKIYKVWVQGHPNLNILDHWRRGVYIDGTVTNTVNIEVKHMKSNSTLLELVMTEGRKRQIRRTAELLGHPVLDLQRIGIDSIMLGSLPEGYWREIESKEWSRIIN